MIYCVHGAGAEMGTSDSRSQFPSLLLYASSMQRTCIICIHLSTASKGIFATNALHAKPLRHTPQARLVSQHASSELDTLSSKQLMPNHCSTPCILCQCCAVLCITCCAALCCLVLCCEILCPSTQFLWDLLSSTTFVHEMTLC